MKRLLVAMVAVAAVSSAFAKVTDTRTFESESDVSAFVVDGEAGEDASALAAYDEDRPAVTAPYPCEGYGDNYFSLDTGSATLWRTNTAVGNVYFDMAMQFNPSKVKPTVEGGTKIAVYMNASSNIVVLAGDGTANREQTDYVIDNVDLAPGEWGRLTLCAVDDGGLVFKAYLNSTNLTSGGTSSFQCLTEDTTVTQFGISGSGAIDDFVIRTTDPFIENPAVTIGGEGYASLADALADDPTATPQLETDVTLDTPLAYGESISVKLNNHTLSGITTGSLVALESTSGDVTTYTAGYFPRTATAGQEGTAANPYEIADADDLVALQDALLADAATFASKSFVQTADIDMSGVTGFYGIGWFGSSDSYASLPSGLDSYKTAILFAGTYDGAGHTISDVQLVCHCYAGVFNNVSGTVKNLTVQNIGFSGTCTDRGCAIVGNAVGATLQNLTASGSTWGDTPNHNAAGIVVRAQGNTTISGCVNNVALSTTGKRLGGILAFAATSGTVSIQNCTNNAALSSTDGTRGVGGILSSPEAGSVETAVVISGCADFGSETAGSSGYTGAIVGSLWSGTHTYTDGGGNTYPASSDVCGFFNEKTVYGLAYALPVTIDAADYLTTVKQADLAAGNTYTLVADVAAGTVYTFDAAGTIAFNTNGYNFAGTVAVADPNMLDLDDATVDETITYTAAGGTAVASITKEEVKTDYNTIAKALDAAEDGDTVVLEANSDEDVSLPTGVSFALNGHTYGGTVSAAAGNGYVAVEDNGVYAVVDNTASTWTGAVDSLWATAGNWSTGVIPDQYTTVTFSGDADVGIGAGDDIRMVAGLVLNGNVSLHHNTRNYSYWPSVKICGGNVAGTGTLTLERIGFTGDGSGTINVACPVVFVGDSATSHDCFLQNGPIVFNGTVSSARGRLHMQTPITFNGAVTLANATMTSAITGGSAPTFNGTVTLGAGATISTYSVTYNDALTIGDGAVVSVGSANQTYGENFTMTGSGRFIGDTQLPAGKAKTALTQSTWTGTCELKGMTIADAFWITEYGNEKSKVCFNNVTACLKNTKSTGSHMVAGIEIGSGGFTINGTYSGGDWIMPTLSGTGTFTVGTIGANNKNISFPADCSEFSGNIAFSENTVNTRLVFGATAREFTEKTICVGSDAVVGAGATWTADEIYLDGIVKASANTSLSTVVGSGKIVYGAVPTGTHAFGEGWSGIGALDYKGTVRIDLASYVNTIAEKCSCDTVEVVEGCTMLLDNYLGDNVTPTLKVSGFVTINDGASKIKRAVSNLTGDGVLVFGAKGEMVNYAVDNVENWNGVITNSSSCVLITNVVSGTGTIVANVKPAEEPAFGAGWEGVYVANHDIYKTFGTLTTAIVPDAYGVSGSTVVIGSALEGTFTKKTESAAPSVAPALYLKANVTINNGFWSTGNRTTFAEVGSDAGVVLTTRNAADNNTTFYTFTKLKDYDGSIVVRNYCKVTIVEIVKDAVPAVGARVLDITCNATGAEIQNLESTKVTVGGVEQDVKLEYLADGADGAGLYVAAPVVVVEITVPAIEHATATVTTNGVEIATSGAGKYAVEEGAAVTITYAADAGYILSGTSEYTIASAEQGSTITITDTEVAAEIAAVYRNDQKVEGYTSLRAASAAAQAGDTVRLVANDTVSFSKVTVTDRVPSGGSIVIDKNLAIDGGNYTVYGVSNAEILNAAVEASPGYDMAADLVNGSNLIGFFVKSGNVTFTNVTLTEFGDTAYVNKFGYTPIQTASAYAGTLTLTGVNFNKFNRTAVCIRGGTLAMTGGVVTANAANKDVDLGKDHFQQPVEIRGGNAVIDGVTVNSTGYPYNTNGGGAIVAWSDATLTNVVVNFTGVGVWADYEDITIVGDSTSVTATDKALFVEDGGSISVAAGIFTGALAVDANDNSTISLTGGTFDRDVNAFCASGYEAKETSSGSGVWVVSEKTSSPLTPGEDDGETYESAADAEAAAGKVEIGATDDVETAVGAAGLDAYLAKFKGKVVDNGDGTFKVVVGLTAEAAADLAADATTNVMVTVAASLPDIIADAASEQTTVQVTGVKPGFYYSISYGTSLDAMDTEGDRVLATSAGAIELTTPAKAGGATAGFYKVNVNLVPKATPDPVDP